MIANGWIDNYEKTKSLIEKASFYLAVDGGLKHCKQMQIQPNLLIGDFDSCDLELLEEYASVPRKSFPRKKDHTDLEIALLEPVLEDYDDIFVYGAFGGRIDHFLANIFLLSRYKKNLVFENEQERLFMVQKNLVFNTKVGQTLSLIALNGRVESITTSGLEWNLDGEDLSFERIGISNCCIEDRVCIQHEGGHLLCVLQNT